MQEFDGIIGITLPKDIANLQLPDIDLSNAWRDFGNRVVHVEGAINGEAGTFTSEIIKQIIRWNAEDKKLPVEDREPIRIYIDSNGGDAEGTYNLIKCMEISKTPIYTVNIGQAASAAGYILSAGHKRFSLPGCSILVHEGSLGVSGTKAQVDAQNKYFEKLDKKMQEFLFAKTKIDSKTFKKKAPQEWWLDEEEALKYGMIDTIVTDLDDIY